MASKDAPPTVEEKARYEKVKEELVKMIQKKRAADKQLVRPPLTAFFSPLTVRIHGLYV